MTEQTIPFEESDSVLAPLEEAEVEQAPVEEMLPKEEADQSQRELEELLPDYEKMAAEDLALLQSRFPLCRSMTHITEMQNPLRYAELRDLGLSPEEAYIATNYPRLLAREKDNRSHLHSAVPKGARGESMNAEALAQARELFGNLSDSELLSLYRRATKTR